MYEARVIARQGNQYIVEDLKNDQHHCHPRSKAIDAVCGDIVDCVAQNQSLDTIEAIHPRVNQITRLDNFNREKTLAANIDHLLIVIAPIPEYSLILIDKYLACAELIQCKASLIINKCELSQATNTDINLLESIYQDVCANIFVTSAKLGYGIAQLRQTLSSGYSILTGQSGVGKSSLINRLLNSNKIKVADLSGQIQQGTHTTSHAQAYSIGQNGKIIDSPGVRAFTPIFEDGSNVMLGFKEFQSYIHKCKFNNCMHINEPNCAVKNAVNQKYIRLERYRNYQTIFKELTNQNINS